MEHHTAEPKQGTVAEVVKNTPVKTEPAETKQDDLASGVPSADTAIEPKKGKKKLVLLGLTGLVFVGALLAVYFLVIKKDAKAPAVASQQTQITTQKTAVKPTPLAPAEEQLARFITPTTGETWYAEPKALPLQGYFTTSASTETAEYTSYYEVGKRGDNTIILVKTIDGGEYNQLFEKAPDGKVTAILHPNANAKNDADVDKSLSAGFAPSIVVDLTRHYDSLSIPSQIDIGNSEVVTSDGYQGIGSTIQSTVPDVTTKIVKTLGAGSLVKTEHTYADTHLTAIGYKIRTPLGTENSMTYAPIGTKFSAITWTTGAQVTGDFGEIVRGCGAGVSVSRGDSVVDTDFVKVGTAASGQVVYQFATNNATVVQKAWQETKDFYGSWTDADSKAKANISIDDFIANHGIFAQKDVNNGWLIYTNNAYAPMGGCAKPVVYLYPTTPQQVSIKVGADVKVSDPLYNPSTGWHVFAWPNGQLTLGGKTYGSLFWEGPGHGDYPGISTGTVVKRADVVATMRSQLALQGLNTTEINDFVDYWQSRIPSKPYVRLSWFNTIQMNQLAPLTIAPKPTTVIRVFLDMAGSDVDYMMPSPQFSAPARTGFTAVEWGGLSLTKLY